MRVLRIRRSSDTPALEAKDDGQAEAREALRGIVGRKSLKIGADPLVEHVLAIVGPEEWPVRAAAMEALLRRLEQARKDELRITGRPAGNAVLGTYSTRRRGANGSRPYTTVLTGVEPLSGRCDCPDYLKGSLGLCKHLFAVLEDVFSKPRRLELARREQAARWAGDEFVLGWDPVRPLTGAGDWLDRVRLLRPPGGRAAAASARRFERDGGRLLVTSYAGAPRKRLELVDELLGLDPKGDPALRALLTAERERLGELVGRSPRAGEVKSALKKLKRPLYSYQKEGVDRFLATGRLLLADDMGLGKTTQAIACCEVLRRTGRARRGLIIAPASLKPQWAREYASVSSLPITTVEGSPAERLAMYGRDEDDFLLINYEQVIRDLNAIRRWDPDVVVLDEAQRIKNWATKSAMSVKGLDPPYRLVLTGTPMENRIEELASIVEWVDEHAMEPKWRLPALHSVLADGRKSVVGVRNLDTLRERLRPGMLRRVRQEVLDQLPPRTDTRVPIELTEAQLLEHDDLNQPISQILQKAKSRPLTQAEFLRLMAYMTTQRIISNGLAQKNFDGLWPTLRGQKPEESLIAGLSSPKLLELRQLVRQVVLEQGRKAVIFSQWRRMLSLAQWAVSDLLSGEGLRSGFFSGQEGPKRRTQNLVEFHDDPGFRVLFASDAGGVGLNLQRAANCVINLELPWNPAVLEQRIGRVYRLGQTLPIDVYNLVGEQGIESRIADIVGSKQAFFKGLFDGETDSVQFDQSASFLTRLQAVYTPEAAGGGAGTPSVEEIEPIAWDEDGETDAAIDEAADPFEDVVETADEAAVEVREPEPLVAVAEQPVEGPAGSEPVSTASRPVDVAGLFSQLRVRKADDGKVLIEAPPEAAASLGQLFEGMAALLKAMKPGD